MKAETDVPEEEKKEKARTNLIRPGAQPNRTKELNGIDEKVQEEDEDKEDFWDDLFDERKEWQEDDEREKKSRIKENIDEARGQNVETEEIEEEDRDEGRDGLSHEATEDIDEEGEE